MFGDSDNFDVDNLDYEDQEYYRKLNDDEKKVFVKDYNLGHENGYSDGETNGEDEGYDEGYDTGGNDEHNGIDPYSN